MSEPSLRLTGISKRFPGVQALRDVSLECVAGEVHAVLGENGSGKSTLLKIASGALTADDGTVEILGNRLSSADTSQAHHYGLATVYQDNSLVPELSVAQNLYLGTMGEALAYRRLEAWAEEQLAPYDLALDGAARVADLSPAQRQFLEVVKALVSKPKVLLLDEPTASLDVNDVETLHRIVRRIVAEGTTVVYVSHRLPEILDLAQARDRAARRRGTGHLRDARALRGRPHRAHGWPADRGGVPAQARAPKFYRVTSAFRCRRSTATRSATSPSRCTEARSSASPVPRATASARCSAPSAASRTGPALSLARAGASRLRHRSARSARA